jgi:hypothetical protein
MYEDIVELLEVNIRFAVLWGVWKSIQSTLNMSLGMNF